MTNMLIVDDELMPGEYLEELVNRHVPGQPQITILRNPFEALEHLRTESVDLLFLDIEMPGLTGFELLERLGPDKTPPTIFTTAYDQYAVKAFELNAIHYLLKPIDPEKLTEAMARTQLLGAEKLHPAFIKSLKHLDAEYDKLALASGQDYHIVPVSEVVRVEGAGSYCTFHLLDGKNITVSKPLKAYKDQLPGYDFIRTHQSHLVNLKFVERYSKSQGGFLCLSNSENVPVSQSYKADVMKQLGIA